MSCWVGKHHFGSSETKHRNLTEEISLVTPTPAFGRRPLLQMMTGNPNSNPINVRQGDMLHFTLLNITKKLMPGPQVFPKAYPPRLMWKLMT